MLQRLDTPLARKATLCLVSTSCYTARRLDKRVTTETNERYHADPAAGRFNKLILPAECLKELTEIIGEALGVGKLTKTVDKEYQSIVTRFGSEFKVLLDVPLAEMTGVHSGIVEGIKRVREGKLHILS